MLNVIYSDKNFIVINKPAGVVMHKGTNTALTLVDELLEKFPKIKNVGDDPIRPGLVHRLDKDTSGIIVVARRQEIFLKLKEIFKSRKVEKKYLAIACGVFKENKGEISFPIGRLVKNPLKRGAELGKTRIRGAREALTFYRVLDESENYSLVELMPKTGRMHQIRVHLKAVNHPVACDFIYGGKNVCCPIHGARQMLHAWKLSFSLEGEGNYQFEADPPADFTEAVKKAGLSVLKN